VSRPRTLTAADVLLDGERICTVVSWYATWEHPPGADELLGADASAHRLLSGVAALVNSSRGHRLVIAGVLNLLHGYGEYGNPYWAGRYQTVFDRAEAMGLTMVGPRFPNGRQADPWPTELPQGSIAVPTYHTSRQGPGGATRQLDFVFASRELSDRLLVHARNEPGEWGPSDHCRVDMRSYASAPPRARPRVEAEPWRTSRTGTSRWRPSLRPHRLRAPLRSRGAARQAVGAR
jgi:hypothetical protein